MNNMRSAKEKEKIIKFYLSGHSLAETKKKYNINHDTTFYRWLKKYQDKGIDGLKSLKRGKPSMKKNDKPDSIEKKDSDKTREELLEELEYVRAENEYLKKLSALVQERKARQQKKK